MGFCSSKSALPQILVLGLDGAGKTTFVYGDKWEEFEPTMGFNYEELTLRGIMKVGIWDVSGKATLRSVWPAFYKNIIFSAIVFVIDVEKEDRFDEARRELHILVNEEELRDSVFAIMYNTKSESLYSLEELDSRLGMSLIHPSIIRRSFLCDLQSDQTVYNEAVRWISNSIAYKE
jgi:ADP-ribosylation factor-like protein 1